MPTTRKERARVLPKREVVKPERGCRAGGIVMGVGGGVAILFAVSRQGRCASSGNRCRQGGIRLERERLLKLDWSWVSGCESQRSRSWWLSHV